MEDIEESYYYSDGAESLDSYDREQLEIALYCKIHFEVNSEHSGTIEECVNNDFDILVEGNNNTGYKASETNADYVLNRDLEKKYECIVIDTDDDKRNKSTSKKSFGVKKVNKSKGATDEVKKSKQIQSLLRNANHGHGSSPPNLKDSGIYSDDSVDVIHIDDDTISLDSDSDSQDLILGESFIDDDDDIKINAHAITARYTYTKMSGESDTENHKDTSDTEHWAINEEDIFKDKGVAPRGRYYKPVRCHNCNYVGHLSKNCPQPKKVFVCALCAEEGHVCRNCPLSFCHNCEEPGHESKYCPAPRKRWNRSCRRCWMPGHDEKGCPEIWRQYHVSITPGQINKFKLPRKRKWVSCYNCGDEGHYGHECEEDRMNRFLKVNSPFITRYQFVREFRDVVKLARSDDRVDQSEDANQDGKWKSFDDIDAHAKTLRESNGKIPVEKRREDKNSVETKKPSQYLHMLNKSSKLLTGRNNFDKMSFTIQNEQSLNSDKEMLKKSKTSKVEGKKEKLKKSKTSKVEGEKEKLKESKTSKVEGEKEKFKESKTSKVEGKKEKLKKSKTSKVEGEKEKLKESKTSKVEGNIGKDLSIIDLTFKNTSRVKSRKRKVDPVDDGKNSISSKGLDEDFPRNLKSESTPNDSGQAAMSKKMRKYETSNKPCTDKDSHLPKLKIKKSKQFTSIQETNDERTVTRQDSPVRKARTVSFNQTGCDMLITAKRTPVKSSSKSSKTIFAADGNKKRNEGPKFSANDLFSLWSIDSQDSGDKKFDRTEPRPRISKKHASHRNDNYAADDLFSLGKISKMQDRGNAGAPVEEEDMDHQVYNNEWWNKGKKRRNRRRRNNQKF